MLPDAVRRLYRATPSAGLFYGKLCRRADEQAFTTRRPLGEPNTFGVVPSVRAPLLRHFSRQTNPTVANCSFVLSRVPSLHEQAFVKFVGLARP